MNKEIEQWFSSDLNYNKGIKLLRKYSRNQMAASNIEGNPNRYLGKLIVLLGKLSGRTIPECIALRNKLMKGFKPPQKTTQAKQTKKKAKLKRSSLPVIIQKIIKEASSVYKERSMLHSKLTQVPDENTDENIKARIELHELIRISSERLDILAQAKKDYFEKDIIPKEKDLYGSNLKNENKAISGIELMKRKKNLESSLSKDRNVLLYQKKTKQEKEDPLPEGEYRNKIEARILEKEKELAEINKLLG